MWVYFVCALVLIPIQKLIVSLSALYALESSYFIVSLVSFQCMANDSNNIQTQYRDIVVNRLVLHKTGRRQSRRLPSPILFDILVLSGNTERPLHSSKWRLVPSFHVGALSFPIIVSVCVCVCPTTKRDRPLVSNAIILRS